jgi:hypothetical protein
MLHLFLTSLWTLAVTSPHVVSECRVPADIMPGASAEIHWTVQCSAPPEAARFEVTLPAGLTRVEPIAAGGKLIRSGSTLRYVWESLPPSTVVRMGLRVTAAPSFRSALLAPTASLLIDGTRIDAPLAPARLVAHFAPATAPTTARRDVVSQGPDVARVTVTVSGLEPGSFVRIEETIPESCTAEIETTDGATCTNDRGRLRFVWFEGTATGSAQVSYRIMGPESACFQSITGAVMHVKGGVSQTTSIPPQPQPQPQPQPLFHVQLLATHWALSPDYFLRKHGFTDPVTRLEHEGWAKYTTGNHATYAAARSSRNAIRADYRFPGPFVTASHRGRRITVQEALLLTRQTWTPE